MAEASSRQQKANSRLQKDWVASSRSFAIAWGLPIAALIAAVFVEPPAKPLIWAAALVWMGAACLGNAARCGRMHCYFTGPFFLVMAVVALLHGFEIVWLGEDGWRWLGIMIGVGGCGLWYLPERICGKYGRRDVGSV